MRQSRCGQDGDASPAIAGRYMSSATPAALDSSVVTSRLTPSSTSASSASGAGRARRSRSPSRSATATPRRYGQPRPCLGGTPSEKPLACWSSFQRGRILTGKESTQLGQSLAIAVQDETHLLARGDQPGSRG